MLAANSASVSPAARWNLRRSSAKRSALRWSPRSVWIMFELSSELGGSAIVAGAENKIEKFFEGWSVTRSAAQNGFEQADGFLRQTVTGEKVDIRQGLSDELLGVFVELRFGDGGTETAPSLSPTTGAKVSESGRSLGRGALGISACRCSSGQEAEEEFPHRATPSSEGRRRALRFGGITIGLTVDKLFKKAFARSS